MTSLKDRPNSALLVVDMQRDVVGNAYNVDRVVENIKALVDKARSQGVPVIWVQHSSDDMPEGSNGWRYIPELTWMDAEPVVHKRYGDSFEETELESVLSDRKVGRVVVTGAQTDACIRSTLHGALVRGYDATLVEDAHTTEDMREWGSPVGPAEAIAYTNLYWKWSDAPGRKGGTVATAEVDFNAT
ncbi:MAG: isochorismatase family protein [Ilumatobacteraceae bacterium]